jgi:hypothetical protein
MLAIILPTRSVVMANLNHDMTPIIQNMQIER